jgi:outer membrane receptor protein involved in Fe transport
MAIANGDPYFLIASKQLGLYFQDDWKITPRLSVNLGLRWDKDFNLAYCLSDGCYRRVNVRGKARYAVESQAEDRHLRCSVKQSPP